MRGHQTYWIALGVVTLWLGGCLEELPEIPTGADISAPSNDIGAQSPDALTRAPTDAATAPRADIGPAQDVNTEPPAWWGEPITSPTHTWQWVDFPDTFCADGSPTGLGINLSPGADKVLIYFEGGGACWDFATCTGIVQTSLHLGGYGEKNFKGVIAEVYKNAFIFDRESPKNALADAHYVFLPYCTGDAFAGDNVPELSGLLPWNKKTIFFKGAHNVKTYLKRLVPTFADVKRVILAGSSAGGFGAGFNWPRFQKAFEGIRVDVIDDSGPPVQPEEGRWKQWREAWQIEIEGCPQCTDGVHEMMKYFRANALQSGKLAFMGYRHDAVVTTFLNLFITAFTERLDEMLSIFDEEPNAHYFVLPGALHTLLVFTDPDTESPSGIPLWYWIEQMVDDDPGWSSDAP